MSQPTSRFLTPPGYPVYYAPEAHANNPWAEDDGVKHWHDYESEKACAKNNDYCQSFMKELEKNTAMAPFRR